MSRPLAVIEASLDMGVSDPWKRLDEPAADFSGQSVVQVPVEAPARFFRLRKE